MAIIKHFRDLTVWQEGHKLLLLTYKLTDKFPPKEQFTFTSQMRRSALSVTSNIAEGFGRKSHKDKEHFYVMAHGSLTELENQYVAAKDLGYISEQDFHMATDKITEVNQLLRGLLRAHRNNSG